MQGPGRLAGRQNRAGALPRHNGPAGAALFLSAFQFLYGKRCFLLLYLPSLGTILTLLLATPVASDLRYAYPLILAMPLLATLPLCLTNGASDNRPVVISRQNV